MHSLADKRDGREILWQGDAAYWKWHAPVCFPIVGVVHEGTTTRTGEAVKLTVHGFARDQEFQKIRQTPDTLVYELRSDAASLARYPYPFVFRIGYELAGEQVTVRYEVENPADAPLYFSLGAHTAFACPVTPQGEFDAVQLVFPGVKKLQRFFLDGEFLTERQAELPLQDGVLPLRQALFADGLIAVKKPPMDRVSLVQKESGRGVQVSFAGFPYLGFWTKAEGAPFVCIEPWYGVTDGQKPTAFEDKEGICELAAGQRFSASYTISVRVS